GLFSCFLAAHRLDLDAEPRLLSPSSRGLGHRPFTAVTRVRIPSGTPFARRLRAHAFAIKASDEGDGAMAGEDRGKDRSRAAAGELSRLEAARDFRARRDGAPRL